MKESTKVTLAVFASVVLTTLILYAGVILPLRKTAQIQNQQIESMGRIPIVVSEQTETVAE